uniref:Uncharacterized protein n=1 Tax=Anguilla anguilla TaxID=7936 RepID=A0A0E9XCW3_ANGAN
MKRVRFFYKIAKVLVIFFKLIHKSRKCWKLQPFPLAINLFSLYICSVN